MSRREFGSWLFGAFVAALAVLGLVSAGRKLADGEPSLGVTWIDSGAEIVAIHVVPRGPADRAGIVPGDRIVAVNGREVESAARAAELPWILPRGRASTISVDRGGRVLVTAFEPETLRGHEPLYGYLALVGAAFLASSTFIRLRWPAVRGARIYGALGAALFALMVMSHTGRGDAVDWLIHGLDVVAASIAPALLIHLALLLARSPAWSVRAATGLAYTLAGSLVAAAVWLEALGGAYRFEDPPSAITGHERLQMAFLAVAVVVSIAVLVGSFLRSASTMHRAQMRWLFWGLAIGLGPFVVAYALPWSLGAEPSFWSDVSAIPMLLVPAATTAAMARYRLNDLDLVLRRGLGGTALAFVVVGTYAASLIVLRRLVDARGLPPDVLGFLAAVFVALAYPKLRTWVRAGVDRAFYRARYSYRATLLDWGRELNAETDLPVLLHRLNERVRETLAVPFASVLVRGGPRRYEEIVPAGIGLVVELPKDLHDRLEREVAVSFDGPLLVQAPAVRHLFAMRVKGRLCAVLAIADRAQPEQPLTSEDRALLATLCAHAAAAIEAARLVREVRQHADEVETLKARQERILESSGVGLLLADAEGRILAWNRGLEGIYGAARDEAIGRRMGDVFPLHTVRTLERAAAAAGPGEEARLYGHVLVNRRGDRIVLNVTMSPFVREEPGGDGARVVTFDDVTERVRLEEQLLRQERLASLGLLAAGVAHEVNTPLTGISSYTQMLLEDLAPGDPARPVLEKIETQSRRASTIANSLLNLARPERSRLEPTDLNEAIREVVHLFEPQIRGADIRLDVRLEPNLPMVRGEAGKLQQVVLNLLLNARDAVRPGGRITVTTGRREGRVLLDVVDDGVGIPEDDLPRIFDPFFTTKGRGRGTGLGLSISYGIVREHDGEMHVESAPGVATRFRVELPESEATRSERRAGS